MKLSQYVPNLNKLSAKKNEQALKNHVCPLCALNCVLLEPFLGVI
jgi:hypothetical protein